MATQRHGPDFLEAHHSFLLLFWLSCSLKAVLQAFCLCCPPCAAHNIAPSGGVHTFRRHMGAQCREASGLLKPSKRRLFPKQSVHTRQYHWPLSLYLFSLQPLRVCVVWLRSVLCCVDARDSIYIYTHLHIQRHLCALHFGSRARVDLAMRSVLASLGGRRERSLHPCYSRCSTS